jgi:hypothetical protein
VAAAAVVGVLLTVLIGTLVLADVKPGVLPGRLVGGHVALAIGAAVVVCVAGFAGSSALVWAGLLVVLVAGAVGLRLYTTDTAGASPGILVAHGAAAAVTALLLLLAAFRV